MDVKEIYGDNVEIRRLRDIEVMTPDGYKTVSYIKRNKVQGYYRVSLSNTMEIKGSGSHKVMLLDGHFLYLSQLYRGALLKGNLEVVSEPEWVEEVTYLYDLLDVEGDIYITANGVTNHNCAFIENIEQTFAAAQPTLSTGGQVMLLSTPNGMGNFFHKQWVKAEMGENTFVPVRLPWQVHPERDQAWRDKQDADLGPKFAAQECLLGNSTVTLYSLSGCDSRRVTLENLYRELGDFNEGHCNLDYLIKVGFQYLKFKGIKRTQKDHWYRVTLEDGTWIGMSENHRVVLWDGTFKEACNLCPGEALKAGNGRLITVRSIERVDETVYLYDPVEVTGHIYESGNLLNHNCDCSFLTSGDTVFETGDMTYYEETYCKDPVERRGVDGNLWIWEYPDYTKSYMVSADVARGDGTDYSTFHVWDIEACTQVAEYKGQMTPRDFGATLCGIASEYNNALLVCENASIGYSTIEEILARGYPNLYYSTTGNGKNETAESYLYKTETGKVVPGFSTTLSTRPLIISKFYDFVHQKAVIIQSKRLLLEMRTFIWKNGKAQGAQGYNDDLVMAAGIGLYVRETAFKLRQRGIDLARASLSGFTNLNKRDPVMYTNQSVQDPYKMTNPYGQQEDIRWLLGK